jgi:MFS family permease
VVKQSPDTRIATGTSRDLRAVAVLFLANGLVVGVFGGSLPGLKAVLGLSNGQIVGLLVSVGLVAVFSMNLSGPLADRVGARLPALLGGAAMAAGALVMGAAQNYAVLLFGGALLGFGNGAMDVCMNALGVSVEQARGRPVMSRLHAFFSIGATVGAFIVVGFGRALSGEDTPRWSLWAGALLIVVLLVSVLGSAPQSPRRVEKGAKSGAIPSAAWLLAAMAVGFGWTEGTAVDWSSLHVTEVGDVDPATGAWGLVCVSGFMVVIRLLGDSVVERFGRAFVVRTGSACAMVGYLFTVLASGLPLILIGWCLVGFGVGLVAPQIYGLAGHVGGGRGLAVVVSFGYGAFLIGPAIIGFTADHVGLQRAMLVPVLAALGLIVLSTRMPADPTERSSAETSHV